MDMGKVCIHVEKSWQPVSKYIVIKSPDIYLVISDHVTLHAVTNILM